MGSVKILGEKVFRGPERGDKFRIIFDRLPAETTSKSWLGEGLILRRYGVKLG